MTIKETNFIIDLTRESRHPVVKFRLNDNRVQRITFRLKNNGREININKELGDIFTPVFECIFKDKTFKRDENKDNWIVQEDRNSGTYLFTYKLTKEVLNKSGIACYYFALETPEGLRISTPTLKMVIDCDFKEDGKPSENYVSEFEKLLKESGRVKKTIEDLDETLKEVLAGGASITEVIRARENGNGEYFKDLKDRLDSSDNTFGKLNKEVIAARTDEDGRTFESIKERIDNIQVKMNDISYCTNVKFFGAKGDGFTDDTIAFEKAINYCRNKKTRLCIPPGVYMISRTLKCDITGIIGSNLSHTIIKASQEMDVVIDFKDRARAELRDFTVDGNGLANTCIDSSYTLQGGPSLNNTYSRVFVRKYKKIGWISANNNDVWFYDCMFLENDNNDTIGLESLGSGGPVQFINCNFLDEVRVNAQYISFVNCVNKGIRVKGGGFNILKYEGGYLYAGRNSKSCVYVEENTELGPVTLSSPHIEIEKEEFLIGGIGKFHYGVNVSGGHIFNNKVGAGEGELISETVNSGLDRCISTFENTWFSRVKIAPSTQSGFSFSFKNCFHNGVPVSDVVFGNRSEKTRIKNTEINIGETSTHDGFQIKTGDLKNVSDWVDIGGFAANEGMYLIFLSGQHLDSPRGMFSVGIPGSFGSKIQTLNETAGIASYKDLKLELRVESKKIQVRVTGGTGSQNVIGTLRYTVLSNKFKR